MPLVFVVLTALSLVALVAGAIWMLVAIGQTHRRSGPEVGAEIMAGQMANDKDLIPPAQYGVFKGTGVEVEREASISFSALKQQVASGQWRRALPALITIAGFFGLVLFGGLTAFVVIENKLTAAIVVLVALYALVRMALNLIRT